MKILLKQVRKRKNVSIRELSYLTQLTPQYLCRLEQGKHNPSGETLDKLCTVLAIEINEILEHEAYNFG